VAADTKTLSTNNGHRDHDMASSLEIDKYPTMRFDLDSVAVGAAAGDSTAVTLLGKFTIHGQQRPVSIPGFAWTTPERVRYLGSIVLDVKDYGVGGLTKMLGVLKMNEHITVHIDVTFAAGH
jgi:polyisoprenoid-binding protein YceI